MSASEPDSGPGTDGRWFATTHWSAVLAAAENSEGALDELCRTYWYPLYAYVRRQGHSPEDAQDLTQAFFERLLEKSYLADVDQAKGKFRSFLLAALKHFLQDDLKRGRAAKRGGGQRFTSLDEVDPEERYRLEPVEEMDAEKIYERRWAFTLLEGAVAKLREEYSTAGRVPGFDSLQNFLLGDKGSRSYSETAAELQTTEGALRVAVHRMRGRFRQVFRAEIAQTVASPNDVDAEISYLFTVLS